jgi:lauroyl/myristoyl acyltransferase
VLTSRAIVSLALRTGAAVLPFCITRQFPLEGDEVRLEIFPPLPLEPRRDPDDAYVQEAAQLFGLATEYLIRRYPAQWRLWNSLEHRWSEAEARC